ncbi:MAG: LysM peptidoglycan-binding domain-containing protein [Planctomycetota bacterium]
MTRELKLSLIAGFTVVLLFGVLLADHLSTARAEPLIVADVIDEPLIVPRVDVPARVGQALPTQPRVSVREPVPSEPLVRPLAPVTEPQGVSGVAPRVAAGETPGDGLGASAIGSIFERVVSAGPRESVTLPGFERVERGAASRSVVPTEPVRARTHEVKAGESLFRIAERYYGNGHLWRKLAERNAGVVGDDGGVGIGVVLTIPSKDELEGRAVAASSRVAPSPVPEEKVYVVAAGDTLSEISLKLLGTTKRMDELLAMNRDQIRDADDIRVGMKLRYRAGPSA